MEIRYVKRLEVALWAASFWNLLLLLGGVFFFVSHAPQVDWIYEPLELVQRSSLIEQELSVMLNLSPEALVEELKERSPQVDGWERRELALSLLVSLYDFDLERALQGGAPPLHIRKIVVGSREITLLPGIKDRDYRKIEEWVERDPWPYTTKGLFFLLKERGFSSLGLKEAFFQSEEFSILEHLFLKHVSHLDRDLLLKMVLEADFTLLDNFARSMRLQMDLSREEWNRVLLLYASQGSLSASEMRQGKNSPVIEVTRPDVVRKKVRRTHVVQPGDSLWKIARKYKTSIQEIKEVNHLKNDVLKPNTVLYVDR